MLLATEDAVTDMFPEPLSIVAVTVFTTFASAL
jgi:hypothetical protein